ncbi:MAG: hypothetical protein ABSB25_04450 [Sedimentisphaerales bacterium]|jgi:hypothetical protein
MGIRFSFNILPKLLPGEKVLLVKPWLWFGSGKKWSPRKSFPYYYRIFFPIPLLCEAGLYVTDRRALLVSYLCRLVILENSIWLKGKGELEDNEFIEETSVGENFLLGTYLEIVSETSPKPWYRSHRARLRLFMRQAEAVHKIIAEAMT